jgi:hypothetical protein
MKSHLRAGLIALASVPMVLSATGSAAAAILPDGPAATALVHTLADPTPSVSPSSSPSPSASESPSTAASASASTASNLDSPPRTNLTAVVDPVAVRVRDGDLIRIGVRNSGPRSITAPAGPPAATVSLIIDDCCLFISQVKSLGNCEVRWFYPPQFPPIPFPPNQRPPEPRGFNCHSPRTLRAGTTYWQSFIFPHHSADADPQVLISVFGYAEDPKDSDNSLLATAHLAKPGASLPVTGPKTIGVAGAGLALVLAGAVAIWYGRRRRQGQPTGSVPTIADISAS